jgi:hypothetical protein
MIGLSIGIGVSGAIRRGVDYARWFLGSGVWDDDGLWSDRAFLWDAPYFLSTGVWNDFGAWDDTQELWT